MKSLLRLADWADGLEHCSVGRRTAASVALLSALFVPWSLPLASIGPLLGVNVVASAAVAAVLLFVFAVVISPLRGTPFFDRPVLVTGALLALGLFAGAAYYLYSPLAAGFPACTGGDAGMHLTYMVQLASGAEVGYPTLGFHSTAYLIKQMFATSPLYSFSAVFHLVVLGLAAFAALATVVFVQEYGATRGREMALIGVATGAVLWLVARATLLPLLHRYQCDGYLAQIFGLLAVLFTCAAYALAERRLLRWCILMLALVFLRLTYVLNAGDILLTYAVLAALEARDTTGRLRRVLYLGAVTFATYAAYAYYSVNQVSHWNGGFAAYNVFPAFGSLTLLSAVLIIALASRSGSWTSTRGRRLQIVAGTFCLLGVIVPIFWLMMTEITARYYFYKYPFIATLVAPCVALPWIVVSMFTWQTRKTPMLHPLALLIVAGLALGSLLLGHDAYSGVYRKTMLRRFDAGLSTTSVGLHANPQIVEHIRSKLNQEAALFGGFYTLRWPEESFTNAMLGYSYFDIDNSYPGPKPGHCTFWDTSGKYRRIRIAKSSALKRLQESGDFTCTALAGRVEDEVTRLICHRCSKDSHQ